MPSIWKERVNTLLKIICTSSYSNQGSGRNNLGPHRQKAGTWNLMSPNEKRFSLMNIRDIKQKDLLYLFHSYCIFYLCTSAVQYNFKGWMLLPREVEAKGHNFASPGMDSPCLLCCQGSLWCLESQSDQDTLSDPSALLHRCPPSHQAHNWGALGTQEFLSYRGGLAFPCYLQEKKANREDLKH